MEETGYIGENLANVLHTINSALKEDETEAFSLLRTDKDRFAFMLERSLVHEALVFHAAYDQKSSSKAIQCREEGNKLFQKREYRKAVEAYTASIMAAPTSETPSVNQGESGESPTSSPTSAASSSSSSSPSGSPASPSLTSPTFKSNRPSYSTSDLLALAFANRSAALFRLREYRLCIEDVDRALQHGYPSEMHYKLHDRRGKCFVHLKDGTAAAESFTCALQSLTVASLEEKAIHTWRSSLVKQLKQSETVIGVVAGRPRDLSGLPDVKKPNERYPRLLSSVDVRYNTKVGRHLRAVCNITVGDVISSERPYASVVLPAFYHNHCYHCLKSLVVGIPDDHCANIQYCSPECRRTAWEEYHHREYSLLNLLGKEWCGTLGHLVFRTLWKVGYTSLMELLKTDPATPDYEKGVYNDQGVYDDGFSSIFSMVTNIEQRVPEGLSDFTVFALYLIKLLQLSGYFPDGQGPFGPESKDNHDLVVIGGAVLSLLQIVQVNARGIIELQLPSDFEDSRDTDIGMGIYPTAALVNHSCDPSAVAVYHNNGVVIKAIRNIRRGQEVSIDYGTIFYRNVLAQRQMNLSLRYSFQCGCEACVNNWPLWRDLQQDFPIWACEDCGAQLNTIKTLADSLVRCDRCNHSQDLKRCLIELGTSHDLYSRSMEEALAGNITFALPGFQSHLSLCQKYLLPPWRDLVVAQAAVRRCFRLQGNVKTFP